MASVGAGADIEEIVKRITTQRGVRGFLILNSEGIAIRHSLTEASRALVAHHAALLQSLAIKAKGVVAEVSRNSDELLSLRLRSLKHEIIVAPDSKYLLIVIQEPSS